MDVVTSDMLDDYRVDMVKRPHILGLTGTKALLVSSSPPARASILWFPPESTTAWHSHDEGQVLHILRGRGFVESAAGDVIEIHSGDTVVTAAGEIHRHGARDIELVQLTCSFGTTHWID